MGRFLGVLLGALFPPAGVWWVAGFRASFWINLVLTLLFYVPGQVHALWVVAHTRSDGRAAKDGTKTFLALLLGLFLPPLGVWWKCGLFSLAFWLNVVLTALFWIPGSLHALWVITDE
ncbi:MAG: YqaE/Pmp3 family membrane protein [Myxococcota bacterium]